MPRAARRARLQPHRLVRLPALLPHVVLLLAVLLSASLLPAAPVAAQRAAARSLDAPVRYEDDLPSADFHRGRREALMERLPDGSVAVLFGAPVRNRSNDVYYEYRQSSDLLYLTGTTEPGSALLLAPGGVEVDGRVVREVLFVPPRDPSQEVWLGRRFGTERAMERLGVELAVEADRFSEIVGPLLADPARRVYRLPFPDGVERGTALAAQLRAFVEHAERAGGEGAGPDPTTYGARPAPTPSAAAGNRPPPGADANGRAAAAAPDSTALRRMLDELRTIKTEEELELLRKAIDITAEAHREVMRRVEPGWAEYEIEALVEYTFKRRGAERPGFPSIVGSGENSVILHYESNRRTTEPGDVVVIDIGAEYHGYTADVTRTIPVSGTFTDEQRAIYDLVLRAQEAGIRTVRAGNPFGQPHQAAAQVLARGLAELGLIESPADVRGLRRFFMHGTSHYLGLDVHDVGTGGPLRPGTVITVEPGVYIAAAEDIDPRWWNIGVRIEDDVLVTEGDPVVLSASAPRTAEDVEALMAEEAGEPRRE